MSEQEELILSENSNIVLRTEENQSPVDVLNRQPEVDRLLNLINTLSNANSSCTFAINGKWGCGKTFLLDMLKRQLMDWKGGTAFTVINYNCWQYDYYDEPLVAILSAMIDSIDEASHLMEPEFREKLAATKNIVKSTVKGAINTIVKTTTGIDMDEIQGAIDEAKDMAKAERTKAYPDDNKSSIKNAIESVRTGLINLTQDQSIIIIVDEIDRCLPEYSIKVLERLHHLFAEIPNVFPILAVDDTQLENTVRMIFGENVDINAYLKKFIDFNIQLDVGRVNGDFFEKYSEYTSLYDEDVLNEWDGLQEYITALFSGIDVRTQEHIMNKITTIHRLLFRDKKKDCSFMCFELLLAVYYRNRLAENVKSSLRVNNYANPPIFMYRDLQAFQDYHTSNSHPDIAVSKQFSIVFRAYLGNSNIKRFEFDGEEYYYDSLTQKLDMAQKLLLFSQQLYDVHDDVNMIRMGFRFCNTDLQDYINDFNKIQTWLISISSGFIN